MREMAGSRNWRDVRRDAIASRGIDEQDVNNLEKLMREEVRAFKLADLRKAFHLTQVDVARLMHVAQPRVSAIERGELSRTELATLESYVAALGGTVKVVADFGDESILLRG